MKTKQVIVQDKHHIKTVAMYMMICSLTSGSLLTSVRKSQQSCQVWIYTTYFLISLKIQYLRIRENDILYYFNMSGIVSVEWCVYILCIPLR